MVRIGVLIAVVASIIALAYHIKKDGVIEVSDEIVDLEKELIKDQEELAKNISDLGTEIDDLEKNIIDCLNLSFDTVDFNELFNNNENPIAEPVENMNSESCQDSVKKKIDILKKVKSTKKETTSYDKLENKVVKELKNVENEEISPDENIYNTTLDTFNVHDIAKIILSGMDISEVVEYIQSTKENVRITDMITGTEIHDSTKILPLYAIHQLDKEVISIEVENDLGDLTFTIYGIDDVVNEIVKEFPDKVGKHNIVTVYDAENNSYEKIRVIEKETLNECSISFVNQKVIITTNVN